MKKITQSFLILLLAGLATISQAKTAYVTDRIELGVHQSANADSPIIATISSGDAVEVMQEENGFNRVLLDNGNEGWIQAGYLVDKKPTVLEYGLLAEKHKQVQQELKEKSERLSKVERTLQVRRDELSNARTTIKELKKQLASGDTNTQADEQIQQQLSEKEEQIKELQDQIEALKQETEQKAPPTLKQYKQQLAEQQEQNKALKNRIELAKVFLTREQVPQPEELEKWEPVFPGWYWGVLLIILIIGIVAGISWMDYRVRQRHGGFRV